MKFFRTGFAIVALCNLGLSGTWPALSQAKAPAAINVAEQQPVTLRFTPPADVSAKSVTLAGSFNNWNRDANPLLLLPDGQTWQVSLRLAPGLYSYKFVVNGDKWFADPNAPKADDGKGDGNSLLAVAASDYALLPGKIGDGKMTPSALRHRTGFPDIRRLDKTRLVLTLRTRRNDVAACELMMEANGARHESPLARVGTDPLFDTWQATLPLTSNRPLRYAFRLTDGPTTQIYDARLRLQSVDAPIRWFTLKPMDYPPFDAPEWARDAVFYQIFPDRFANGDMSNDPSNVRPWGSPPSSMDRMGGDLAGILQHLDYLRGLGVNALYLNPVFTARSAHGYDTTDYHTVDPAFGANQTLTDVVAEAHKRQMRVVLDGVFNHTGVDFAGFKSLQVEGEKSAYKSWYYVKGFPIEVKDGQQNYEGWFGSPWMPKLNVGNPPTRDYLLDVATRWIREAKIDGWRLDAADEVDHAYWKAFRKAVREANSQAYLIGEIWGDARDWLQGDQFDSAMNYRWRGAALDFFAFDKLSPSDFDKALLRIRQDYPPDATGVMFNMLGSHDVERVRTLCKSDTGREKQAFLFQMTYPGTPCLYYGDEIGIEGGRDPDNRRAMVWDEAQWNQELYGFTCRLLKLRSDHKALRRGDYKTVLTDDPNGVFVFLRTLGKEHALVAFNRSGETRQIMIPGDKIPDGKWSDWLPSGAKWERQGRQWHLELPPRGLALLGN